MIVGIDASNVKSFGGITHIASLLKAVEPGIYGIQKMIIWGPQSTLSNIEDRTWLEKRALKQERSYYSYFWKFYSLPKEIIETSCDVLFSPGGFFLFKTCPIVSMSQNMLPFEPKESRRYRWRKVAFRLRILRWLQMYSFCHSRGVIFLTNYARREILKQLRNVSVATKVIPHGVDNRFVKKPRKSISISSYSKEQPFRILYVSIIDLYKHQWIVAEAVSQLRKRGLPITLELIGPAYDPALKKLQNKLKELDPERDFIHYLGTVPHQELDAYYANSDLFIFASSCENMPNILLEAMASGLPIVCSNCGPMPEVLQDTGLYFDPEDTMELVSVLDKLIMDSKLRETLANRAFNRAQDFTWNSCADLTFKFMKELIREHP